MDEKKNSSPSVTYIDVHVGEGADAFVEALIMYGIEYIFINSGTDTFPVQEALARKIEKGEKVPEVILCLDESMGLSAAHGYYQITGKPQAVLVHVDAGTAQLGGALHNAQRSRAAMLIVAGRSPLTFLNEVPGGRDLPIHWIQEQRDQAGIVRTFTKWDYELRNAETTGVVINRAIQVATTEPAGPVYLVVPRESLMQKISSVKFPSLNKHPISITPQADQESIDKIANKMLDANSPLIIVGRSGRNKASVSALENIADICGAQVTTTPTSFGFPNDHPAWVGMSSEQHIENADMILIIDCDVPWIPAEAHPRDEAYIACIDIEPVKESMPLLLFPANIVLQADSSKALVQLLGSLRKNIEKDTQKKITIRKAEIQRNNQTRKTSLLKEDMGVSEDSPIDPKWLIRCIAEEVPEDSIILEETVTNRPRLHNVLPRNANGDLLVSGGASLGWAIGAAVGVKLAEPEKDVIALVGDGAFVYGAPTSAIWASVKYQTPFLTIIFNNSEHFSTRRSLQKFYPESAAKRINNFPGLDISPSPNYADLARASGAYGEIIEDPSEIKDAIKRGLSQTRNGVSAILDVRLKRP